MAASGSYKYWVAGRPFVTIRKGVVADETVNYWSNGTPLLTPSDIASSETRVSQVVIETLSHQTLVRVTQEVVETLQVTPPVPTRVSQLVDEIVQLPIANARVSQLVDEIVQQPTANSRVSQLVWEPVQLAVARSRTSQLVLEVILSECLELRPSFGCVVPLPDTGDGGPGCIAPSPSSAANGGSGCVAGLPSAV